MTQIKRKTAIITGASQRIGRAIALDLSKKGWCLCLHYNDSAEEAEELAKEITRSGGRAIALHADLSRASQAEDLVPRAIEEYGEISCLINNASIFEPDDINNATADSWDKHMNTNNRAPFILSQSFAAQFRTSNNSDNSGNIINIIDKRAHHMQPNLISYTLSKAGLWEQTRLLSMRLAPHIRVNAISPGLCLRNKNQSQESFMEDVQKTPLKRTATKKEICTAIDYIMNSPSMTGQMITLDGGTHLC